LASGGCRPAPIGGENDVTIFFFCPKVLFLGGGLAVIVKNGTTGLPVSNVTRVVTPASEILTIIETDKSGI